MNPWPRKVLGIFVQIVLAAAVLWFGGRLLLHSWRASQGELASFQWSIGILAVPSLVVAYIAFMGITKAALARLGAPITWPTTFRIWSIPQAASYIPGKVWFALMRFLELRRLDIPAAVAVADIYIEEVNQIPGSIAVGLLGLAGTSQIMLLRTGMAAALLAIGSVVLLSPRVSTFLFKRVAASFKIEAPPLILRPASLALLWVMAVGMWIAFGSAFAALCYALAPSLSLSELPRIAGAYTLAWLAGLLSMIPGGLVAREGMLVYLLGPVVGRKEAIVAAAVMRLATVGSELAMAAISAALVQPPKSVPAKSLGRG